MIPKIIHYCWFGKREIPKILCSYIETWNKKLQDYTFYLWNEDNFDLNLCPFARQAYDAGYYAHVSDYVRIYALYHYGGIYLDTDIEVIKPFDSILNNEILLSCDDIGNISGAFIAAKQSHPFIKEIMKTYESVPFFAGNGKLSNQVINYWIENLLIRYGYKYRNKIQILQFNPGRNDIYIYSDEYFEAKSLVSGKFHITRKTHCIHHHTLLWVPWFTRVIRFFRIKIFVPILGQITYVKLCKFLKTKILKGTF